MATGGRTTLLIRFYSLLDELERCIGGARYLATCSGDDSWPTRGVYFFREPGEVRSNSGNGPRIVRVGTHGLNLKAKSTLWSRLRQHKGNVQSGAGNHRGSVFREHVGTALIARDRLKCETWLSDRAIPQTKAFEAPIECAVTKTIGLMPLVWLQLDDEPGPNSQRGYIERNAIALLSNYGRPVVDPPSPSWLGRRAASERVRESGLWNSNHVDERCEAAFLDLLELHVKATPQCT